MWETRSVFHISMPLLLRRQDSFRRWWPIAQRRVRTPRVVMHSPLFDHDPGLLQRVEDLPLQTLVLQLPVEALTVTVFPWTAWFDVQRLGPDIRQPLP